MGHHQLALVNTHPEPLILPVFLSLADNPLVRGVARVPATVNRKLLVAFVGIVVLLVTVGVLGLRVLGDANDRVDTLGKLQQRTAAYQNLQTDAAQLQLQVAERAGGQGQGVVFPGGNTSPGAISAVDGTIESTLSTIGQASGNAHHAFVPPAEETKILSQIQQAYGKFSDVIAQILVFDKAGDASKAQLLQSSKVEPLAQDLVALTQQLVTTTTMDTNDLIASNTSAYAESQHLFIGVAAGSVVVALLLGFVLSRSLIGPIRKMDTRLAAIASGDFSGHVDVPNRDELGALATNLNRMNDQLGRLYGELETASRHKSEFLANMSHELRTPLNAVIGFSEVLQDRLFGDLNDKQAEYVADIHASGRHLLALINDILDLSKIEAGRMDLQITPFALSDLVQNSVALSRERATREGIALGLEVDPDIGVIEADERMLKQVLFNLLSNALKFTPRGGHVAVNAHAVGDDVVVIVRDDGVGIAPADQARIFEEFQQVGTAHLQEGTGLGLAISRRFIELHGGSLRVESEPGHGSTFTFTLPRTQGTAIPPESKAPPRVEVAAMATHTTSPRA
jgi:signal transduction histidine kinase